MSETLQSAQPQPQLMETLRQSSLANKAALFAATLSVGLAAEQYVASEAEAQPTTTCQTGTEPLPNNGTVSSNTCTTVTSSISGSEVSSNDIASGKIKVLANIGSPMSKASVRRHERNGDCFQVGKGTQYPRYLNQGYNVGGSKEFGPDSRRSEVCRVNGVLIRVACKNRVKLIPIPPTVPDTKFVSTFVNAKLVEKADSTATANANARCTDATGNVIGISSGSGSGSAHALASIDLRTYIKSHGRANAETRISVAAAATAKTEASAKATAASICIDTPPPPPPPTCATNPQMPECSTNTKPTIELVNPPQHTFVNGRVEVCAKTYDAEKDPLKTEIMAQRGTVSNEYLKNPIDPNVVCVQYTAPSTKGSETITATTTDGKDARGNADLSIDATATATFPNAIDQF